jgi:hypothetical protein
MPVVRYTGWEIPKDINSLHSAFLLLRTSKISYKVKCFNEGTRDPFCSLIKLYVFLQMVLETMKDL